MEWYLVNINKLHKENPYLVYYRSEEEIVQLKVGDSVLLNFKSDIFHLNERYGEFISVVITERDEDKFKGELVQQPEKLKIAVWEEIEFSDVNIVGTTYANPKMDVWNYYLDMFVKISLDVINRNEINLLERTTSVADKLTGWTAYTGYEDHDYIESPNNYVYKVVGELLQIDDTVLELLHEPASCTYKRDEKGNFVKVL